MTSSAPFVLGAAITLIAAGIGTLLPLGGVARIDPAQALRTE
jgi:ABC-type antimicrobial peptide transport system permease subunit